MRWIPTLLPLALVGCGGESEDPPVEQGGAPEASASIPAELWPDDAVALLLVPSADHLVQTALEISAMFADEPPPFPTDGAELLALAGASGDLTQVDLSRPLAITLLMQPGPRPAFLLPVRDGERFRAALDGTETPVHLAGDYALVGADPGEGTGQLVAGLPDGLLTLRIDMAVLGPLLAPMIDPLMASAVPEEPVPGFDMSGLLQQVGALGREFIASSRTLDLTLDWLEGRLVFGGNLALVPESPLTEWVVEGATGAAELARGIDPDASLMFVGGVDPSVLRTKVLPWAHALVEAYPEPLRESLDGAMEQLEAQYDLMGRAFAGSQDFGKGGMHYTYLLAPDDPEAVVESLIDSFYSTPFMGRAGVEPQRSEEHGIELIRVPMVLDPEALAATLGEPMQEAEMEELEAFTQSMFGESPELVLARRDGHVVARIGPDSDVRDALDRVRASGPVPAPLAPILAEFGDANPLLVMRMDLASVMRGALELATELVGGEGPEFPEDSAVDLTLFAAGEGDDVRFGLHFDLAAMARLFEALDR